MRRGMMIAAALGVGFAVPAAASAEKCAAGYKDFLGKISPFVERVDETELPALMRRGIAILDACNAGDDYSAAGSWLKLAEDARSHTQQQQANASGGTQAVPPTRLILSHLPLKTSRAYHQLLRAGGNAQRDVLAMTKAEVWLVPADNVAGLRKTAEGHGVRITQIEATNIDALTPMASHTMTAKQSSMMHEAMSDRATMGVTMMGLPAPETLEYALTRPADKEGHATLQLKLSDKVTVVADRISVSKEADSYIWQGEIEGAFEPVSLVYWPAGRLSGTVQYQGHIYKVQSMSGGAYGIIETAPAMLPPEHAPMSKPMQQKMNMRDDPLMMQGDASQLMDEMGKGENIENLKDAAPSQQAAARAAANLDIAPAQPNAGDPPVVITLIVAYTRAAARHYADISKDLIALAVAEANLSFKRSGISNVRLETAHIYETDYVEQGTHFEHMFRFAEKGDGYADEIHGLRERYHADVALMIVDDNNGCGLSAGVAPPADRAFAVVHHGCAAATYSLAHELGHVIGARHDTGYDDNKMPFAFGHGYVNGKKWRTMMSYEQSCDGCPRLPIWSNPDVRVHGEPAGNEVTNNARVIREGAKRVAAFR